jgi:hypothetical protein
MNPLAQIAAALGLGNTATLEAVLGAIADLQTKAGADAGTPPTVAARQGYVARGARGSALSQLTEYERQSLSGPLTEERARRYLDVKARLAAEQKAGVR